MNVKKLFLLTFISLSGIGKADAQTIGYLKKYGPGSSNGGARSITHTRDGNLAIAGAKPSGSEFDIYIVKTKSNGDTLWTRTIGAPVTDEFATSITQIPNIADGFYVTGISLDASTNLSTAVLWQLDETGTVVWKQSYPVANSSTILMDLKVLNDGLIMCGMLSSQSNGNGDGWLVKVNNAGVLQWQKTYGGAAYDEFNQLEKLPNGNGFMIGGATESHSSGANDQLPWVVKTDNLGTQTLSRSFVTGGTMDAITSLTTASRTVSGGGTYGYVFTGYKNKNFDPNNLIS